nr:putative ribonuclease H-like domain-containing protein [Tanacetum cinerariifolium]
TGYDNQRIGNVAGAKETVGTTVVQKSGIQCYNYKEFGHVARECQKPKRAKDAAYHKEKMLLYQELEAHYMYMAQIQEVTLDAADNFGPIFDSKPLQKVSNDDNYNVFAIESEHPEQSKSVHDTYLIEQDEHNVIIDSLDMSYDREQLDQDDDDDLANERELFASLIEKLKCKIDDSKNRNKFLETSNKALVDKLKGEIEDFKNKNKSLESSNNHFKEANNNLSKINEFMYKDLKKFQAELDRRNDVKYASKMEIDCAKAKEDLMSYKMESEKSFNAYTQKINDLNQTTSKMKKELFAHQETISIMSQAKEAHIKLYKTHEDKELDKVIALENKVNVLDNIVYKTGQSVQTMNMLNRNCKTSFAKPKFLKKAQRANPRMYDIEIILFIVKSGCSKHMAGNLKLLTNFVEKFLGSRGTDLYSITLHDTSSPNPISLLAKATSSQAWLWHRRLSHLNFNTINLLSKNNIVIGLPKLKFIKDRLCSSWINHQTSVARTPEQNGVVERWNRTLVEAARIMLSVAKVPLFFWAEAIATSCFTQNRSLVIPRHEKTPYHVINDRKPSVKFFYIFGSLCCIIRDGKNLDKMKEKDHISFDPISQCQITTLEHDSLSPGPPCQENVPHTAGTITMSNELDLLFSPMFDELLNGSTQVVSKSSAETTADAPNQCQ